jgi:RHS repeat-associated protein
MFTGREFDKETGLNYYRARYYRPEIGRFLQADQVGYEAGMNLYRYCRNNPWNATDSSGHCASGDPCCNEPCDPCNHQEPCDYCEDDPCALQNYPDVFGGGASGEGGNAHGLPASPNPFGSMGPAPGPLRGCPLHETEIQGDKRACKDTAEGQGFHPGETCYRQVVPKGSANQSGLHCCYRDGRLSDAHPDAYQPAIGGGGGTCEYDYTIMTTDVMPGPLPPPDTIVPGRRMCMHFLVDVGGILVKKCVCWVP